MENNFISNQNQADNLSFGQNGIRILTGSSAKGEVFGVIITASDTATYTVKSLAKGGDKNISKTAKEGHILYGSFTDVVVTEGTVEAYLK